MQKLDKCPIDPACVKRVLFRDEDGNLFQFDARTKNFKTHECNVMASELPTHLWVGEWFNERTGRTRFTNPVRLKRSAMIPPNDNRNSKKKNPLSVWKFIQFRYVEIPEWQVLKEDE